MARFLTNTTAHAVAEFSACIVPLTKPATMANGHNDALAARCTR